MVWKKEATNPIMERGIIFKIFGCLSIGKQVAEIWPWPDKSGETCILMMYLVRGPDLQRYPDNKAERVHSIPSTSSQPTQTHRPERKWLAKWHLGLWLFLVSINSQNLDYRIANFRKKKLRRFVRSAFGLPRSTIDNEWEKSSIDPHHKSHNKWDSTTVVARFF